MGTTSSITMQSLGKIVQRAQAVGAKMWCLFFCFLPAGCREAANCRYCFYSQTKNQVFRPPGATRCTDSGQTLQDRRAPGTWVRLAVQNFTSVGAEGWECGPQNIKNFHFGAKSRPAGATPLTDFHSFKGFYTPNAYISTLVFQISYDSHHSLRSYCGETARR